LRRKAADADKAAGLQNELDSTRRDRDQLKSQTGSLQSQLDALKQKAADADQAASLQPALDRANNDNREHRTRIAELERQLAELKKQQSAAPAAKPAGQLNVPGTTRAQDLEQQGIKVTSFTDGRPASYSKPMGGKADDLKRISGVGPKLEKTLHELGIYHFSQIAEWNNDMCEWINAHMDFPGRIQRDSWVDQSKLLAEGKEIKK